MNELREIYHISNEQERINYLLEESGGELTPEIEEALIISQDNLMAKAEDFAASILAAESIARIAKERASELQTLAKKNEKKAAVMRDAIGSAMRAFGMDKITANLYTFSFRKSVAVEIDDEVRVPARFTKVSTSVDKVAIKNALKRGELVEGAYLVEGQNLQLK
uniref:siphovirus Gp157 family protein n=1 Tax=Alistipes sp. TaxID=1872444 RepID=UPI0040578883